jgi:hypothetical protein
MRALAGEVLLAAWEQSAPSHELLRPLMVLSAAYADAGPTQLGALPIAERNLMLLRLHRLSFGPVLRVFGVCQQCGARLEFEVPVAEMTAHVEGRSAADPIVWSEDGRQYRLRPVSTDDLVATLSALDLDAAQELLLRRCLEVSPPVETGQPAGTPAVPVSPAVLRRFEELHAAAELSCAIECPSCACREVLDFDIARFLWAEVQTAARRLLGEIHELASAYGWSQQDIAAMSPTRRRAYLELLSA